MSWLARTASLAVLGAALYLITMDTAGAKWRAAAALGWLGAWYVTGGGNWLRLIRNSGVRI